MKWCPNCKETHPEDQRFCNHCGTVLVEVQPFRQTGPLPNPDYMGQTGPSPVPDYMREQEPGPKKKLSTTTVILLIAAACVVAVGLFVGGFFLTRYLISDESPLKQFSKLKEEEVTQEDVTKDDDASAIEETEDAQVIGEGGGTGSSVIEEETADTTVYEEPEPTPTPTPVVWGELNFNMDVEQANIEEWVRECRKNREHYNRYEDGDTYCYKQSGTPVILGASDSVGDWKYNREYVGVAEYYAELDDGVRVVQQFYFEGSNLFRVIDEDGVHDYGCEGWEKYDELGKLLKEDRMELLKRYN